MADYCVPQIIKTIKNLGGLDEGGLVPGQIDPNAPEGSRQLGLSEIRHKQACSLKNGLVISLDTD
jgi:hypothetical protein